jgi:hypothetical protein
MADFATALAALDQVTGWSTLERYLMTLENVADDVLAGDPLGAAIRQFLVDHRGQWSGTMSDLHGLLLEYLSEGAAYPKSPKTLSGAVTRLAPALRSSGIDTHTRRTSRSRIIELSLVDPVGAAPVSANDVDDAGDADDALQGSVSVPGQQEEGPGRAAAASCGASPASLASPESQSLSASSSPLGTPSRGGTHLNNLAREYPGICHGCGINTIVGAVTGRCRSCWPLPGAEDMS